MRGSTRVCLAVIAGVGACLAICLSGIAGADELFIGAATGSITPDRPVALVHTVRTVALPIRKVTEAEMTKAKAECESLLEQEKQGKETLARRRWHERIVDRYEWQQANPVYSMELHAIRLGDVAICTNPFELFTDYGVQIKARSKAVQTFVI